MGLCRWESHVIAQSVRSTHCHTATRHSAFRSSNRYLFIVVDVFVRHAGEELLEVLPLVALPALPVGLQVGVETLHLVLAFLHLQWQLP